MFLKMRKFHQICRPNESEADSSDDANVARRDKEIDDAAAEGWRKTGTQLPHSEYRRVVDNIRTYIKYPDVTYPKKREPDTNDDNTIDDKC